MKIFASGCTGFVGGHLCAELLGRGHQLRLLTHQRQSSHVAGVEMISGEVTLPESYVDALQGCDAVINLVGIIREFPGRGVTFARLHEEATRNMVAAARENGIGRYLQMSALGTRANAVSGGKYWDSWRRNLARQPGEGGRAVEVKSQPFGGAIRILEPGLLRDAIGDFHFDSERSCLEQDFRIFVRPSAWESVRDFCIEHLSHDDDAILETGPERELAEEFADALKIRLKPDHSRAYCNLGVAYGKLGLFRDAIIAFKDCLKFNNSCSRALLGLGIAYYKLGELSEAAICYITLTKLQPRSAEAWHHLGALHARLGEYRDAIICLSRAIRLRPAYAEAHFELANVFLTLGQARSAISHFRKSLQINPGYIHAICKLGSQYGELYELCRKREIYEKAQSASPNSAKVQINTDLVFDLVFEPDMTQRESIQPAEINLSPQPKTRNSIRFKSASRIR